MAVLEALDAVLAETGRQGYLVRKQGRAVALLNSIADKRAVKYPRDTVASLKFRELAGAMNTIGLRVGPNSPLPERSARCRFSSCYPSVQALESEAVQDFRNPSVLLRPMTYDE